MFAKATVLALVGAVAVSALDSRAVHNIVSRQLSASSVPSACQSTCSSALTIYNACLNGDSTTCLSVCQPDNYSGFVGCFDCIVTNTPGVTQSEVDQLNSAIAQLQAACAQAGQTVSAASLTAGSGSASGSATGSLSGALASATGASFTSASGGGLTIGGTGTAPGVSASAASATGAATSRAQSLTSAAASAASSAAGGASAAASSKGAAGIAAPLPNFLGAALGLVGLGAGAAFVL